MNMVFLYTIIVFLSDGGLALSENETLALNAIAINNIMKSKIPVNTSQLRESKVMNYFYGGSDINDNEQQLDTSIFEPEEVKLLYETAQSKDDLIEREFNKSRRWYYTAGFIEGPEFINQSMDLMRQSVYGTRYRLKDTKYLRKFFSNNLGYKLALLYGSLMQLRIKMDNIYSTMYSFNRQIKFLWHIVLYERCLATTVDANDTFTEGLKGTIKLEDMFQSLANAVVENYPPHVMVKNLSIDLEQLDLKNITNKLNSMRRSLNTTDGHEIVFKEFETRRLGPQGTYYDRRDAHEIVIKTKTLDLMLQTIYMARHKIQQLEKEPYFNSKDTSYRIAFLYRRIRRMWKRLHDIYTTMVVNKKEKKKFKKKFRKVNTFLNLHYKAAKIHVDFLYQWWVMIKMHEKYHYHKRIPNTYPPED